MSGGTDASVIAHREVVPMTFHGETLARSGSLLLGARLVIVRQGERLDVVDPGTGGGHVRRRRPAVRGWLRMARAC